MNFKHLVPLTPVLFAPLAAAPAANATTPKPNILVIYVDDLRRGKLIQRSLGTSSLPRNDQ
jgi:hypothetical protein